MTLHEVLKKNRHKPAVREFAMKHFLRGFGAATGIWLVVLLIILRAR